MGRKPLTDEEREKSRERRQEYLLNYYLANRTKIAKRSRAWKLANPERARQHSRTYQAAALRNDPEKRRKKRERNHAYYVAHKGASTGKISIAHSNVDKINNKDKIRVAKFMQLSREANHKAITTFGRLKEHFGHIDMENDND